MRKLEKNRSNPLLFCFFLSEKVVPRLARREIFGRTHLIWKGSKNNELEIKMKGWKEEKKQEEAAKNQKLVAESSVTLTATLDKFSKAFITSHAHEQHQYW